MSEDRESCWIDPNWWYTESVKTNSRCSHVKSADTLQVDHSSAFHFSIKNPVAGLFTWMVAVWIRIIPKWWIPLSKSMNYKEFFRYVIVSLSFKLKESKCDFVSPNSGEHPLDEEPQWERQNRPKTPPCSPKLIVPPAEIPSSLLGCMDETRYESQVSKMKNLKDQQLNVHCTWALWGSVKFCYVFLFDINFWGETWWNGIFVRSCVPKSAKTHNMS